MTKIKIALNKKFSSFAILLSVIILSTIIGLGVHLTFAWLGPDANPPNNNVAAPITSSGGTITGDLTINGNITGGSNLTFTGNLTGANRFLLAYAAGGVYDDGTSNAPYSRVTADSFHTSGLGVGQMYIEGYAIDANSQIRIGTGLAGGQAANTVIVQDMSSYNTITVNGASNLKGNIYSSTGDLTLNDNVIVQNGYFRLPNYAAKPACSGANLGAMVFDTAADKPFVCVSTGWKDLDRDTAAEWKPTNTGTPNAACAAAGMKPVKTSDGKCILHYSGGDHDICDSDFGSGSTDGICVYMTNGVTGTTGVDCAAGSTGWASVLCTPL